MSRQSDLACANRRLSREGRIVAAITRLALDLGMSVTAEGVENELQHQTLVATGCGFAQGHFYGVPSVV